MSFNTDNHLSEESPICGTEENFEVLNTYFAIRDRYREAQKPINTAKDAAKKIEIIKSIKNTAVSEMLLQRI